MVGALLSLLWCLIVLSVSLLRPVPPTSLFPEIDFASKIPREASLWNVLARLSMASSWSITRQLAAEKLYLARRPTGAELEGQWGKLRSQS